jgi:hypothetical protein
VKNLIPSLDNFSRCHAALDGDFPCSTNPYVASFAATFQYKKLSNAEEVAELSTPAAN